MSRLWSARGGVFRRAPGTRTPVLGSKHPFIIAAIVLTLCGGSAAAAQQGSLQGLVTSATSGAPLEGVAVVLEGGGQQLYRTSTDRNGFYQLGGIAPGGYSLRGRHVGHVPHEQSITLVSGDRLTVGFRLKAEVVALEGVTVSARTGAAVRDLGRQRVTPADLRLVPTPAGSGDLTTYLQTLPGVTTTGDRGGQLFVRGGTSAENLVLVDGIPIYQPFHIIGFFSVFPEDLVSSVDFYAGGFGARYSGRTSSVLDVGIRDGDQSGYRAVGSASPFVAEALVEGPIAPGVTWIASVRHSLVEETSDFLPGPSQPIGFSSGMFKLTATAGDDLRCSALALHTSDGGRLDLHETDSRIDWQNLLIGGRCVAQLTGILRLVESNFSFTSLDNAAVSRGSSRFRSSIRRMQHDAHATSLLGSIPLYTGYHLYTELMDHDLTELFGVNGGTDGVFGIGVYLEAGVPLGKHVELRPGVALTGLPRAGAEPRIRASWEPFGRSSEKIQAGAGLYRQDVMGTSDIRDVSSVFTAWMSAPDEEPVEALHAMLGWQQSIGQGLQWSLEGYHKRMKQIPVPRWSAFAEFATRLQRADGEVYGADTRIEYTSPRFHGFVGYGYGWTRYQVSQKEFSTWFGDSVQRYHPPHDRRHQVNVLANLDVGGFKASARWQLGSGLPFTRPMGFDEAFDYTQDLQDVSSKVGRPRLVLEKPFNGRLPSMHRLDLSLQRGFDLSFGRLTAQVGAINAYDRRNMFYYDLFTARRVDQLPLSPYASITVRGR